MTNMEKKFKQIEDHLVNLIASKIAGTPGEINKEESFFSLGVESIILQEIMSELDKEYDHLPPTLLFEYPNILQLTEYLANKSPEENLDNTKATPQSGSSIPEGSSPIREEPPHIPKRLSSTLEELPLTPQDTSDEEKKSPEENMAVSDDGAKSPEEDMVASRVEEIRLYAEDDSQDRDLQDIYPPPAELESKPKTQQRSIPDQRGYGIAVIGMNGRFPKALGLDTYWQNLFEGRDCIEEIPKDRWDHQQFFDPDPNKPNTAYGKWGGFIEDIDKFDPLFFNISPLEAEQMDPQQRLLMESTWATMEHAGYGDRNHYKDKMVGVFVGMMWNEYSLIANQGGFLKNIYAGPGSLYWAIANRISYVMDFKGPSIAIDTACSSSLVAVHLACHSILNGDCDMAIAGGINLSIHPSKYIYLSQAKFLSKDGRCRSFGEGGSGYVPGEGVGTVLLKPLEKAIEDGDYIYGIIRGSSTNHGGKATGFTVPNPEAQARLIVKAFERADISPEQIGYLESHGTGTSLGDPIEINGLTRAFQRYTDKRQFCPIGSVKSNIGHLEAAAGVAALIKVLLCMEHNQIPKSLHSEIKNPNINFEETPFYVVNETMEWASTPSKPKIAGISSFGAGGSNAHVIVESFKDRTPDVHDGLYVHEKQIPQIIALSAKNEERLKEYAGKMLAFLEMGASVSAQGVHISQDITISNIAYTLQVGREAREERLALIVSSISELRERLAEYCQGRTGIKDCYKGNARGNRTNLDILLDGEEGSEFLKSIIQNRKHKKIAQLWVAGTPMDWRLLYSPPLPRRIALPAYPFARERYWIPESSIVDTPAMGVTNNSQKRAATLHPMIDQNTSTLQEERFSTVLSGEEFYLKDHIVDDQKILPGVAYLEMARAAGEIAGERKIRSIRDIVWIRPITVGNTPQMVHICLSPGNQAGSAAYEVITNGEGNQRTTHAQGKVIYENGIDAGMNERIDIDEIKKRCTKIKEGAECYRLFLSKGFMYGPSFQPIKRLWTNANEALSLLALPTGAKEGTHGFVLHPSMMDGALQAVIGLLDDIDTEGLYLPFAMGEVEIGGTLPDSCYAHVTLSGDSKGNGASVKRFSIRIADETGQLFIKIKDFSLRAMQRRQRPEISQTKPDASRMICYTPLWEKAALDLKSLSRGQSGDFILFDTDEDARNALMERLPTRENGKARIVLVKPGKGFKDEGNLVYEIDPSMRGDYALLLDAIKDRSITPSAILHLWSKGWFSGSADILPSLLERGVYSLFYLTQALMEQKPRDTIKTVCLFSSTADMPQPQYAALSGFARTVNRENPRFVFKIIDSQIPSLTQSAKTLTQSAEVLLHEMQSDEADVTEIRYKEGQRWVKRLREFNLEQESARTIKGDAEIALKDRGVYVITGGAGGLGLIFAEYLARTVRARLALSGRSDLTPDKESQIKGLESLGSEVAYIKADISLQKDAQELIQKAKARFNRINGIIHCAGVVRDAFVIKKTRDQMDAVLAPKIYGTVYLDEATKSEQLDFFVFFSSITAVMGNAGQCDYAFGNSFMDNFASMREALREKGARSGKTLSINWPLWKDGGMRVDEQTENWMKKKMGMVPMKIDNGLRAFQQGLALNIAQLAVAEGERDKINQWLGAQLPIESAQREDIAQSHSNGALQEKAEGDLIQLFAELLKVKINDLDTDVGLDEYGMDSIIMMTVLNRLEGMYGDTVEPNALIDYPTIKSFAEYLIKQVIVKPDIAKEDKNVAINSPSSEAHQSIHAQTTMETQPVHSGTSMHQRFSQKDEITQKDENTQGGFSDNTHMPKFATKGHENIQRRFSSEGTGAFQTRDVVDTPNKPKVEKIAVIGMACRFPQSNSIESFWENLLKGGNLVTEVPEERWRITDFYSPEKKTPNKSYSKWGGFIDGIDLFDAQFFGVSDEDALVMDPQQRLLLELTQELMDRAGYPKGDINQTRTGVFIGGSESPYVRKNMDSIPQASAKHMLVNTIQNMMAARISDFYNLTGPSQTIDTACSSSLVAVHQACQNIRNGECEMAIAGGVELLFDPFYFIGFSKAEVLSDEGKSYVFDERAKGIVLGEGIGAVLLKSYEKAIEDGDNILAVISGSAVNNDGQTMGLTVPSLEGQKDVIRQAIRNSGITPDNISYLETHGTGTLLGDPIEIKAGTQIYREYTQEKQFCAVGSVKSNMGHLLHAAGIASFIKVVLSMHHKQIPATLHCERPHPRFKFETSPFYPVTQTEKWSPRRDIRYAAVSAFGFGGTNCHLVMEEFDRDKNNFAHRRKPLPITQFKRKRYWLGKPILSDKDIFLKQIFDQFSKGRISKEEVKREVQQMG